MEKRARRYALENIFLVITVSGGRVDGNPSTPFKCVLPNVHIKTTFGGYSLTVKDVLQRDVDGLRLSIKPQYGVCIK